MSSKKPAAPQRPAGDARRGGALAVGVAVIAVIAWMAVSAGRDGASSGEPSFDGGRAADRAGRSEASEARRARDRDAAGDAGVARTAVDPHTLDPALSAGPLASPPRPYEPVGGEDDPGPGREYIERYRGRSGALSPSLVPGMTDVTTRVESPGGAPRLVAWVPTIRIQAGQPARIHAALVDGNGSPVEDGEVVVSIGRPGQEPEVMTTMTPVDADDHHYEHVFTTPATRPDVGGSTPLDYDYRVQAMGVFQGEQYSRVVVGSIQVHFPAGAIDPASLRVEREGGDVVLRLAVQVERAATFWGYAELWGGDQGRVPIAFARDNFPGLTPGRHEVSLRFGGAIIRDVGADGPYVVRSVRWVHADALPPQEQDPIPELPPTPAWRASEFE